MFLVAIGRSILFALQSFWRNLGLSLATIFIVLLALVSIDGLLMINSITDSAILAVKDKIDVTIFFHNSVLDDKVAEIKSHLETMPQVKTITYLSSQQNLDIFKSNHASDSVIQETLTQLSGNPLGPSLIIKAKELADYPEILSAVDNPAYAPLVEEKSYDDQQVVINRISSISQNIKKGALAISLIFIVIAILIVFNTVRIAIYTRKNEVGIMKLVGATNWFVRAPFIIESMISGITGWLLSIFILYLFISIIQPRLSAFFDGTSFDLATYFNSHFLIIFGVEFLGIVFLNVISSIIAVGWYLRV